MVAISSLPTESSRTLLTVLASLLLTAILACIAFLIFVTLGFDKELAKVPATIMMAAFPSLYKTMDERKLNFTLKLSTGAITPISGYVLPVYVSLMYASLMIGVALLMSGFLPGFILGFRANYFGNEIRNEDVAIGFIILVIVLSYRVGRWIGIRSSKYGILCALLAPLVGSIIITLFDLVVSSLILHIIPTLFIGMSNCDNTAIA